MNDCGISKLDLKRRNRMQILRVVREQGPISRVDISTALQITRAAVTIITNEMISQHILEEIGEEPVEPGAAVKKGRRKILLDINATYRFALGVYVDEKEISVGLTTLNLETMDKKVIIHGGNLTAEYAAGVIASTAKTMLQNSCLTSKNLIGIGIGVMPAVWQQLDGETTEDGVLQFPLFQRLLTDRCNTTIYLGSAVTQFAMAGVQYQARNHVISNRQLFLHWGDNHFYAIPMQGAEPLHDICSSRYYVENMIVVPDGREAEGYPRGSVRAELSLSAIQKDVSAVFSEAQTPALYQLTDGDLTQVTLASLLTASEEDVALIPVTEQIMAKFSLLLNNLRCAYFSDSICLHGFGFTQRNLEQVQTYLREYTEDTFADTVSLSPIQERYRFLCGCIYAVQEGFFRRGGLS